MLMLFFFLDILKYIEALPNLCMYGADSGVIVGVSLSLMGNIGLDTTYQSSISAVLWPASALSLMATAFALVASAFSFFASASRSIT